MNLVRVMPFVFPLKWLLVTVLGLALVGCGGSDAVQQTTVRSAVMTGDQEVPPVATGAIGSGTLSHETPSNNINGSITLDGMAATAAHIHQGDAGVNGPVIVTLVQTSPGVWSVPPGTVLTDAQAAALSAGGLYFNAHTAANPNGEVRGQIGREVFAARLTPLQEVPPTASTASGTGTVSLDPATRRFTARISVAGLAATGAHIHPGVPGVNGGVIFPLTQTATGSGVWVSAPDATMTDAQVAALRAGELYFNAHSAAFPNGEIRGQIGRHVGFATMTGAQEVPPTLSPATGSGVLVVDPATRAATGSIAVAGMAATAAHIHLAAPGANGGVIVPLTSMGGGVWAVPANTRLTAEQFAAFRQGNLYYNAHSTQFPNGEIRGQIR